jgi:TonB-linked SusC/RagA family outer membrane protein
MKAKFNFKFFVCCCCFIFVTGNLAAQNNTVRGTVTDENGELLPGVNVALKGSSVGTATDVNGNYSITASSANGVLVFSYIGYATQEISIGNQNVIDVAMKESAQMIDEVVVVGYGVQRKRDLTGAISQVKGDEIRNVPTAGITGAMVGKVSGVDFVSGTGAPGSAPAVRIRGVGTFNSSDPLVVIDGIVAGDMNQYNPNDVESIEVLKDASAAAIYGTRAANGVILITTKKGKAGDKMNISFNAYGGASNLAKKIDLLQAPDLAMLKKEAYVNSGSPSGGTAYSNFWANPYYATQRTDWQDAFFTGGNIYNADLSIRGGNDKSTYYTSFGYFKDKGIINPSNFERFSLRVNSDHKITKWLKIGQNLQYTLANKQDAGVDVRDVLRYNPSIPVTYEDGSWGSVSLMDGQREYIGDINNPVMKTQTQTLGKQTAHRLQGNITLDIELMKGLYIKGNYGVNAKLWKSYNFYPMVSTQPFPRSAAILDRSYDDEYSLIGETYATWFKEFNEAHTINLSAGYSAEKYSGENFSASRTGFADESEDQIILNNGQTIQGAGGGWKPESALSSWFGRAFYSYRDKYLLTVTGRADGSSRFAKGNRWGFFPAFSAGWRISEESFLENVDFLSNLKLTGGWGSLGNQSIGEFQYLSTIQKGGGSYNDYNFGGNQSSGSVLSHLGNKAITWERTDMLNLGLEAGFFNNKLTAGITYFDKNTKDMLLPPVVVGTMGTVGIPPSNIGEVNNHGLEIELGYRNVAGDFSYQASLNATFMKNKVTKLYGGELDVTSYIPGPTYSNSNVTISRTFAGDAMGSFYGHKTAGIYQNQSEIDNDPYLKNDPERKALIRPGDVRFVDVNNDGKVDEKDRTNLGNPNPSAILGFNAAIGYKGFDLSANFTANLGFKIYNADRMEGLNSTSNYNMYSDALKRWHGEGTGNTLPRMLMAGANLNDNYRVSDLFVEDGTYLMLRNLTLGYTLPKNLIHKMGLGNLRVYVTGQNLFVLTGYSGISPELGYSSTGGTYQRGVDIAQYPITRAITGGITLDF